MVLGAETVVSQDAQDSLLGNSVIFRDRVLVVKQEQLMRELPRVLVLFSPGAVAESSSSTGEVVLHPQESLEIDLMVLSEEQ